MAVMSKEELLKLRRAVMEKEFSRMNAAQKTAVFTTEGPLLILAGAGSGKTTVIVNRIANIIRYGVAYDSQLISGALSEENIEQCREYLNGVELAEEARQNLAVSPCPPWKVMAITFTNKAAGELKERLCTMLGEQGEDIWASTFHSSCARMLRRDADRLGYTKSFTIYDTDDSRRLMKNCLRELDISEKVLPPKAVLSAISKAKDELLSPEEYEKNAAEDFRLKTISRAYRLYQGKLQSGNAMDFDDLIVNTVRLFKTFPDVLQYYQNRFRYVMVDEYQDTNRAQYEFVSLLARESGNICVVGDDDQSIYKFRGATIENILNFEKEFSGARVIRLEQNYRSTQNILDAANSVIEKNERRKGKTLWTDNGSGKRIGLYTSLNELDEADHAARTILDGVSAGRKFSDYAVLYRTNSQSHNFEVAFTKQGIPHRIIGGTRFYDRVEIKDMLAYLCVVDNHDDEIRLRRIINSPARGIGEKTIETAAEIAMQTGETLYEVISHAQDFPALSRTSAKLAAFCSLMEELSAVNEDEELGIGDLLDAVLEKTAYREHVQADDPEKAEDRLQNLDELASNIRRYEENGDVELADFLEEVALITDIDNYDNEADTVVLMTIHSAKGLEFQSVFLPGWEENLFPGAACIYNPEEIEEERRLAYVAITRAKEELYISSAKSRMIYGSTSRNPVSRFVRDIPEELLEKTQSKEIIDIGAGIMPSFGRARPEASDPGFEANRYKKKAAAPSSESYMKGDTVEHRTFGTGIILSAVNIANDTLLEIAFDKVGTKKIFANFAKLKKL